MAQDKAIELDVLNRDFVELSLSPEAEVPQALKPAVFVSLTAVRSVPAS